MAVKLIVAIWSCCLPLIATAQTNPPRVLNVTVVTEDYAPVGGLGRDDFSVAIDKLPQNIVSFSDREVPASVGILVDISGSFDFGKKNAATLKQNFKEGLERFVRLSHPSNEYFVMTFNESATLVQDWTSDYSSVTNSLDLLKFKGQTSLYDAIMNAIPKVTAGRNSKQVLLVVSDGMDNQSKSSFNQVREALKRSDVLFYGVGILDEKNEMRIVHEEGAAILDQLAWNSGGRAVFAKDASRDAFIQLFDHVAAELRSQYQLVISPPETSGKEKWRKLVVKVARNDASGRREKLYIRTKQGYYR